MDRDAAYGEVIPAIDTEPATLEEPARAFTGLYEKRLDPRIRGDVFQSGIDRRADEPSATLNAKATIGRLMLSITRLCLALAWHGLAEAPS